MAVEADSNRRADQAGVDRAHPGEELGVDDGVDSQGANPANRAGAVQHEALQRPGADDEHLIGRDHLEQIERLAVLLGAEHEEARTLVFLSESLEHRARQHERAHFRQEHDQDAPHGPRLGVPAGYPVQEREQPAQGLAGEPVEPPLAIDTEQIGRF